MLSRTADHLFWMARYMERAENTARMLDVNYQMSLLPQSEEAAERGWRGMLSINEISGDFAKRYHEVTPRTVIEYMVNDAAIRQLRIDEPLAASLTMYSITVRGVTSW